jgi:hypothetical protein
LATTTGIVLYEITKQRREYQAKYKRAIRRPKKVDQTELHVPFNDKE